MTNQDVDADLKAKAAAATLQAMGYTIERLSAENESLIAGIEQSRRTSDYWKAEHLAGNAETESLRAQLDQCNDALAEIKHLEAECGRLRAMVPRWIPIGEKLPGEGAPVQCFSPEWIDEDFNPNGVREGFRYSDGTEWHTAVWVNDCDAYGTTNDDVPTHWLDGVPTLPSTPSKEQNAND